MAWLEVLFAMCLAFGPASQVSAASKQTQAKLYIEPTVCIVDVVQDGNAQTVQVPDEDCYIVLPRIITPVLDDEPVGDLPFAGEPTTPTVPLVVQPAGGSTPWSPIATTTLETTPLWQSAATFSTMLAGIGTVAAATALGVDAALFEMGHSRSLARWARARLGLPFGRNGTG
jgi:hypothetical protein